MEVRRVAPARDSRVPRPRWERLWPRLLLLQTWAVGACLAVGSPSGSGRPPPDFLEADGLHPTKKLQEKSVQSGRHQHLVDEVLQRLMAAEALSGGGIINEDSILTVSSARGREPIEDFDYETVLQVAKLAAVAQCQPSSIASWTCSRCWRVPDFTDVSVEHDEEQELLSFIGWAPALKSIVVVFRGTVKDSLSNWLADLKGWHTDKDVPWCDLEECRVHDGFFNAYNSSTLRMFVSKRVAALLEEHGEVPVMVTGHSLGGALASLCAVEMATGSLLGGRIPAQVHLNTLGSPRVGSLNFTLFALQVLTSSIRVTHSNDIVPSLPLLSMGFQHLAREIWLADITLDTKKFFSSPIQIAVVCDGSGEDPNCHAGQCGMGICTSTYNHVHGYFNMFMGQDDTC